MAERLGSRGSPRLTVLLVGAVTLAGLLLRLPSFDDSLYADELATYFIATDHSLGDVIHLTSGNSPTGDLSPPLMFMVASVTGKLGGSPESLRLSSLVAGVAAIPCTYLLGLWTVGRRAALVGAALIALSPFLIFYSTEARAYALVMLLTLLSTLALLRALQTGRWEWWAAYAACSLAALYTHYTPVFLLAAQFAWAFWTRPDARRALVLANLVAAVGFLPWLPTLLDHASSPGAKIIGVLHPFTAESVRRDLGRWSMGHPFIALTQVPGAAALALLAAGFLAGLVGVGLKLRAGASARSRLRPSAPAVLIVVLALATPLALALRSSVGDSVWDARNLTVSWPGLALAAGALVTGARGLLSLAGACLVVGGFAIGSVKMLDADNQRPDYAAAARFITQVGAPGDPVVELPSPAPWPLTPVGDVALNRFGRSASERHPVLRLGVVPLEVALHADPYSRPPPPPREAVFRQAASLARDGTFFLVAIGPPGFIQIALAPQIDALPQRFRHVQTRTFPGFETPFVQVYRAG